MSKNGKRKRDQYRVSLPADLVVLPDGVDMSSDDALTILSAHWYEANHILLASAQMIAYLSEDNPADVGLCLDQCDVARVADCLKRWNPVDGFYHA